MKRLVVKCKVQKEKLVTHITKWENQKIIDKVTKITINEECIMQIAVNASIKMLCVHMNSILIGKNEFKHAKK